LILPSFLFLDWVKIGVGLEARVENVVFAGWQPALPGAVVTT
jgi:hypothetical protein